MHVDDNLISRIMAMLTALIDVRLCVTFSHFTQRRGRCVSMSLASAEVCGLRAASTCPDTAPFSSPGLAHELLAGALIHVPEA